MVPLFKHWRTTYERIDKFLSDTYFTDVNLYGKIICETEALSSISHLNVVTQPQLSCKNTSQIRDNSALTFDHAISSTEWKIINSDTFTFGPTWTIHWFKVCFCIPEKWLSMKDISVELQWKSGCEVLVFSSEGNILKGLNSTHLRISVPISMITDSIVYGKLYYLFLQASCSDLCGAGKGGMINPPSKDKMFKIETARLAVVSTLAVNIYRDLKLLLQIAEAFKDVYQGHKALYVCNETVNTLVDLQEDNLHKKMLKAQQVLQKFFMENTGATQQRIHAMGHCHIDSAWLWRYCETRRKLARSWSNSLRLLEKYPQMTFVCSQAQQLAWLKEDYPELFSKVQNMAKVNKFLPAGGVWVEMDVNLPCCESLCRQFLYGQRFFKDNFGSYCKEFWLPDTFGYSSQLPQIMKQSNISRFMTQKLSWSLVNKFPHHTFWWSGLDGSKVLTHFPPGDSYSMNGTVTEILHTINNFSEKGRSSSLMYLYGYGDGGQGPTEEMIHVLERLENYDGLPKIKHSTPDLFFSSIERTDAANLFTWVGELYLELHNGTYTTQRQIKKGNTTNERLLKAVELLVCIGLCHSVNMNHGDQIKGCVEIIKNQLESKWKTLLLNQFHDVLPGSSIEDVCDDAFWALTSLTQWCTKSIIELSSLLLKSSSYCVNPTSWPWINPVYAENKKEFLGYSFIPPHSVTDIKLSNIHFDNVEYEYLEEKKQHKIKNQFIEVSVDEQCRITNLSLVAFPELGNVFNGFGNELFLFDDVPLFWDAWDVMDYHQETEVPISSVASFKLKEETIVHKDNIQVTLTCLIMLENTGTTIEKSLSLHAHLDYVQLSTKVTKWNEIHKFLKIKLPTRILTSEVQYHTQAGMCSRPCHRNTSWDSAKFEVCSHEWINIGEANWGIAVMKNAIFGSSVEDNALYLSLLRSPTAPDATADRKHLPHLFSYAIYPYSNKVSKFGNITAKAAQYCWSTTWDEILANDIHVRHGAYYDVSFPISLKSPSSGEVSIDWIKPSCDEEHKFILRIHEQVGGRYSVNMVSALEIKNAYVVNILEEAESYESFNFSSKDIDVIICPFKIFSVAVQFSI